MSVWLIDWNIGIEVTVCLCVQTLLWKKHEFLMNLIYQFIQFYDSKRSGTWLSLNVNKTLNLYIVYLYRFQLRCNFQRTCKSIYFNWNDKFVDKIMRRDPYVNMDSNDSTAACNR